MKKNRTSYQPGPEKETPLSFHQEKKYSTHQPVEGEKERTVGDSKICAQTQTDDSNYITAETTQTEQLHSDDQALHKPTTDDSNYITDETTQTEQIHSDDQNPPQTNNRRQ